MQDYTKMSQLCCSIFSSFWVGLAGGKGLDTKLLPFGCNLVWKSEK